MFEDGEKKRIFVENSICNGCHMCESICSFVNTNNFCLARTNIKVINYEWKGWNQAIVSCDVETHPPCEKFPQCVKYCPTGALIWATKDEFASQIYKFQKDLESKPPFKSRAPWSQR